MQRVSRMSTSQASLSASKRPTNGQCLSIKLEMIQEESLADDQTTEASSQTSETEENKEDLKRLKFVGEDCVDSLKLLGKCDIKVKTAIFKRTLLYKKRKYQRELRENLSDYKEAVNDNISRMKDLEERKKQINRQFIEYRKRKSRELIHWEMTQKYILKQLISVEEWKYDSAVEFANHQQECFLKAAKLFN